MKNRTFKYNSCLNTVRYWLLSALLLPFFFSHAESAVYDILVAEVAKNEGRYQEAALIFYDSALKESSPELARKATHSALFARDLELAEKSVTLWIKLEPTSTKAYQTLITLHYLAQNRAEAQKHIPMFLKTPDYPAALLQLGEHSQQPGWVLEDVLAILNANQKIELVKELTQLALMAGDAEKMNATLTSALQKNPLDYSLILLKSKVLLAEGQPDKAAIYLEEAFKKIEPDQDGLILKGRLYLEADQLIEAKQSYLVVLKDDPKQQDALLALGLIELELGEYNNALLHLKALQQELPQHPDIYFYLGYIYERKGDFKAAISHYKKVSFGTNRFAALLQASLLTAELGDMNEAHNILKTLMPESDEESIQVLIARSDLFSFEGKYQEAMALINQGLKTYPEQIPLFYARALVNDKMNQHELAVKDLKLILNLEPDHIKALNALGYLLATRFRQYKEALVYIDRALVVSPDDPAVLDSAGWTHFLQGQYKTALNYLEKAYRLSEDTEILVHYYKALIATKNTAKANALLIKHDQLFKNDPRLQSIKTDF